MTTIPERLLFQLAHVELINPDPEGSARFFHDVLGLEESGRDGRSIYLSLPFATRTVPRAISTAPSLNILILMRLLTS